LANQENLSSQQLKQAGIEVNCWISQAAPCSPNAVAAAMTSLASPSRKRSRGRLPYNRDLALTSSIDLMKILPLNARESNALRERFCKLSNNAKASYLVSMNLLKFAIKHSLRRLAKFAGH
jgi:hypothetical protein